MACYAHDLCTHNTMLNKMVTLDTVKSYMKGALTYSAAFHVPNPTFDLEGQLFSQLHIIYEEHKIWEEEMRKRKPVSEEMFFFLVQARDTHKHSKQAAIADWLTIGRQAGLRISEYGQDDSELRKSHGNFALNDRKESKAFIMEDFSFYGPCGVHLPSSKNEPLDIKDIHQAQIRWRYQKNRVKNEKIWYAKNDNQPHKCVIRAMLRIRQRALNLHIPSTCPIGVYSDSHTIFFITNNVMRDALQYAAKTVHKITDPEELKLYSSHSIRVMACVFLHAAGKDTTYIKHRLRWKSDAFMEYLRHVPVLAKEHNDALIDSSFYI